MFKLPCPELLQHVECVSTVLGDWKRKHTANPQKYLHGRPKPSPPVLLCESGPARRIILIKMKFSVHPSGLSQLRVFSPWVRVSWALPLALLFIPAAALRGAGICHFWVPEVFLLPAINQKPSIESEASTCEKWLLSLEGRSPRRDEGPPMAACCLRVRRSVHISLSLEVTKTYVLFFNANAPLLPWTDCFVMLRKGKETVKSYWKWSGLAFVRWRVWR